MKQSLKYGLLLILALLIHAVSNQAMENNCKELPPAYSQEECFVSQDHPIHNALERLYHLYTTQSCDLGRTDITQVPTNKSILLPANYTRGYKSLKSSLYANSIHIPKYLSDPITHYIYGLRKIII